MTKHYVSASYNDREVVELADGLEELADNKARRKAIMADMSFLERLPVNVNVTIFKFLRWLMAGSQGSRMFALGVARAMVESERRKKIQH